MPNQPRTDNPARSVRVPDDLWLPVKTLAAEKEETITDVIIRALQEYREAWRPHNWVQVIPTEGPWCIGCGLDTPSWHGQLCTGEGAAEAIERRMHARLADVWEAGYVAADNGRDADANPYRSDLSTRS